MLYERFCIIGIGRDFAVYTPYRYLCNQVTKQLKINRDPITSCQNVNFVTRKAVGIVLSLLTLLQK